MCPIFISFFVTVHYKYALGHFNYLHDFKCPTPVSMKADKVRQTRLLVQSAYSSRTIRDCSSLQANALDVECHENYDVAFGDFMISLVPILDARRIDLLFGRYHCTQFSKWMHASLPYINKTRRRMLLWYLYPFVNYFFDALVVVNTIFLIVEIAIEDEKGSNYAECSGGIVTLCILQVLILCIFVVELITKVYAYGLPRFFRSLLNKIDLFAIIGSFAFLIFIGPKCGYLGWTSEEKITRFCNDDGFQEFNFTAIKAAMIRNSESLLGHSNHTESEMIAYLQKGDLVSVNANVQNLIPVFRIVRIFRLFRVLRSVRVELRVVNKLAPLFLRFLGVLFFFFYIFGVIGMELFAGQMHYSIESVQVSSYGLAGYYVNTFDNIYVTFMTLFELMVVNNWNIIMEGYVAATGTEWTRLYFIVWFVVSVVVVMNVCAGFVIDAYSLLRPKMKKEVKYLDEILYSDIRSRGSHNSRRSISRRRRSRRSDTNNRTSNLESPLKRVRSHSQNLDPALTATMERSTPKKTDAASSSHRMRARSSSLNMGIPPGLSNKAGENEVTQDETNTSQSCWKRWVNDCFGGREHRRFQQMSLKLLLSHIDTAYMISSMPTISREQKGGILFDQQLQNQLNIRVREHEHSYNQLSNVFDDADSSSDEEED
jgi:hypothetical protein